MMPTTIWGVVKGGMVMPNSPLPEGAQVEIRLCDKPPEIPKELQEELEAWQRAGAEALDLVERLAQESKADEKG